MKISDKIFLYLFYFLIFLFLMHVVPKESHANEGKIFQQDEERCEQLVQDNWPTKRIELAQERTGKTARLMALRCYEPACKKPFSWFLYEVRYINGEVAKVNCSVKDGDEPRLDRYNDQNRFTPPE